jgi:hypothetical protein
MLIHCHIKKSKPKKLSKEKQRQHDEWLAGVVNMTTNFSRGKPTKKVLPLVTKVYQRETRKIPSLNPTNMAPCTKPNVGNVYTGDKMLGIGTLHKSNAVPVFNTEEAREMARMRRG